MGKAAVYVSGAFGDAVLHVPLIRGLARFLQAPVLLINDLTDAANRMFAGHADLSGVVSARDILLGEKRRRTERFAELLKGHGVEELYLFNFRTYVALAARRAGVRKRVGFVHWNGLPRALLLTHWAGVHRWKKHPRTLSWMKRVFERNRMPVFPEYPAFFADAPPPAPPRPLLALGVNGSGTQKQYGAEHFARLVAELERAFTVPVDYLLFGASDVAPLAARIKADCAGAIRGEFHDLTAQTPAFEDSCRWMSRCVAYVGNDSFGLHLALAQRLPTVGLFWFKGGMDYLPWLKSIEPRYPELGSAGLDPAEVAFETMSALRLWCPQLFVTRAP